MTMGYKIGLTTTMTALDALASPLPIPNFEWQDAQDEIILGNGQTRGIGSPLARWTFALSENVAARNALKAFCPGRSAEVYIATQRNDGSFANYSVTMHWPLTENKENGWDMGLVIEFTNLVVIP